MKMRKNVKRLVIGICVLVLTLMPLAGCSQTTAEKSSSGSESSASGSSGEAADGEVTKGLPEGFDEETVRNQALEDIRLAESDDYEGWKARFAEELQSGLTEDAYTSYLAILEKKGAFKEFGSAAFLGQVVGGKKYGGILIIAKHEKEDIKYNIAYDEDMNLITFTI